MNYINRALVKQQAKDIIRGKFFYIFLVSLIVILLSNMSIGLNTCININNLKFNKSDFEFFNDKKGGYNEFYDYYSGFGDEFNENFYGDYDNPIEDFEFNGALSSSDITPLSVNQTGSINAFLGGLLGSGIRNISFICSIVFMPLLVTLAGMYLSLVRKSPDKSFDLSGELSAVFKNSFNGTYSKKLVVVLLRNIFLFLLTILFIVPGVVFFFSSYFAKEIMSDNPNLKSTEAIKLSKKMIEGNRTELFILELSFIPWYLLTAVTFGLASVYVIPYVFTTRALYYENFRMRALQNGKIVPDDFKSFDEKVAGFTRGNSSRGYSYTAPAPGTSDYYYAPPQSRNRENGGDYYANQSNDNPQPQQDTVAGNAFEEESADSPSDHISE